MLRVQLYLLPLSSSECSSNALPSWKMGKGCRWQGRGAGWYPLVQGTSLGFRCAGAWQSPGLGCGVRAGHTPGLKFLWGCCGTTAPGVSLCLTGMEVSLLASPSTTRSSGSCWSGPAAQCLCWRVWAPTGSTGVGTDSKASPGYSSPARCKVSSLGTAEGSRRWPRQ